MNQFVELRPAAWIVLLGLCAGLTACGAGLEPGRTSAAAEPTATPDAAATVRTIAQAATVVPTATPRPSVTATPVSSPTPLSTARGQAVAFTPYPTNTPRPARPTATPTVPLPREDHFWLARPFPRDPDNVVVDYLSRTYPYGTTGGGQYNTHHGVDIPNVLGTPVLATGEGWVIYAGDDYTRKVGPQTNFYGNVVIIEHDTPAPNGQPLYSLYGHLSRISVEAGQRVKTGEVIGEVGATGVALGSHLHLEVRIGDPFDYGSTVNPDLWLQPWEGFGVLAGKLINPESDEPVYDAMIIIRQDGNPPDRYTYSYADDTVNPDPVFGEDFTRGDLPAGNYRIFVRYEGDIRYEGQFTILPGKTTMLDIVLN